MQERTIHLRIKIKSLASESRIIRKEARKTRENVKWNLNNHRTEVVRKHIRHNLLAYGILRNIPYETMEARCHTPPNFEQVKKNAHKFGATTEDIDCWIDAAKAYLKPQVKAA